MSQYYYNAEDIRDGLTGVVASIAGDTIKLVGNSRSVLVNTAEVAARLVPGQGPQSLVGKRVRLRVDYVSGHESIRVEAAPETVRSEPTPLWASSRESVRVSRYPGV